MTATGKAVRYPRSFGVEWRDSTFNLPAVVGLTGTIGVLVRDPAEAGQGTFDVQRTGGTSRSCSVDWRVEGIGPNPVRAEHFAGGVLPEGIAAFPPTGTVVPVTLLLSLGSPPPSALTGRVVLFDPTNCQLAEGHAELAFSIAAGVITDEAVVSLNVPFTVLDPENTEPPPPPPSGGAWSGPAGIWTGPAGDWT